MQLKMHEAAIIVLFQFYFVHIFYQLLGDISKNLKDKIFITHNLTFSDSFLEVYLIIPKNSQKNLFSKYLMYEVNEILML